MQHYLDVSSWRIDEVLAVERMFSAHLWRFCTGASASNVIAFRVCLGKESGLISNKWTHEMVSLPRDVQEQPGLPVVEVEVLALRNSQGIASLFWRSIDLLWQSESRFTSETGSSFLPL